MPPAPDVGEGAESPQLHCAAGFSFFRLARWPAPCPVGSAQDALDGAGRHRIGEPVQDVLAQLPAQEAERGTGRHAARLRRSPEIETADGLAAIPEFPTSLAAGKPLAERMSFLPL